MTPVKLTEDEYNKSKRIVWLLFICPAILFIAFYILSALLIGSRQMPNSRLLAGIRAGGFIVFLVLGACGVGKLQKLKKDYKSDS